MFNTIDIPIPKILSSYTILFTLLKSPAATRPLLEEPIRVIPQPSLQRILLRLALDPAPVVLPEIGVVHEQRSVHVGQQALVDVLLDQVAHPLVQVLVGLVDLLVVGGKGVGEVQLDEDVVCVCGDVEEVLLFVSGACLAFWE